MLHSSIAWCSTPAMHRVAPQYLLVFYSAKISSGFWFGTKGLGAKGLGPGLDTFPIQVLHSVGLGFGVQFNSMGFEIEFKAFKAKFCTV